MSPRHAPVLFGLILSGIMSLIVSGVASVKALGFGAAALASWLPEAWLFSWAVAFPSVLVVAPIARRLVARLVREGAPHG